MERRVIIHADVDAFYASVEQRDRPELRGKPIAVGGSPERRGVIMTASYEARKFGVHSAMPSRTAVGLCRDLILVPARFDAYHEASKKIMGIFADRAKKVEPLSLDEAFLDVSDRIGCVAEGVDHARRIKAEVRAATNLTISLGIARTKLVAKMASDHQKPNGLTAVPEGSEATFLAPLPIRRLWGVGPKTEEVLKRAGIERIGQLAEADDASLIQRIGPWAVGWRAMARGEDRREVSARDRSKQMSREVTFDRDTTDRDKLRDTLRRMATDLADALPTSGPARTVHIKLRFGDFRTITRQRKAELWVTEADLITEIAHQLLDGCWNGARVRLIGLGLSNFQERDTGQLSLFAE